MCLVRVATFSLVCFLSLPCSSELALPALLPAGCTGTRTDIRAYLKVLERQYIFRSGAVDQTHIDTIMANKDKCLRLTAPRMLTAAVLLEDIE